MDMWKSIWKSTWKTALFVLIADYLWLSYFGTHMFIPMVEEISRQPFSFNATAAVIAYAILIIGIHYFCVANQNATLQSSALFGFVLYGLFDATNMAIFPRYKWNVAIIDTLWGTFLAAATHYTLATQN